MNINKLSNVVALAREKSEKFFYGNLYPVIFSLSTFLFWVLNLQLVGLSINILAICFILFTYEDALPTLPIVCLTGMSFRNSYVVGNTIFPIIIFGLALCAIIFNFIKYPIKKLKIDSVLIALIVLTATLLLGGAFSPFLSDFAEGLPIILTAGVGMFFVYFFFTNKIAVDGKTDVKAYFCHTFLCAVNVACSQAIFAYVHSLLFGRAPEDGPSANLFFYPGGFCWANTNHIGSLILLAVPICYYLITHTNNLKFYLFELSFLYICMLLTFSDGALAMLVVFTPVLLYFTFVNINKKNYYAFKIYVLIVISIAVLAITYLFLFNKEDFILNLIKRSSDNGRIPVYIKALELLKDYPLFGVGLGHGSVAVNTVGDYRGFFHSTFFHIAASCGIVGICSYVFLYYARLKRLAKNGGILGIFAIIGFLMFAIYAIVENSEFSIVVLYLTIMIAFVGFKTKKAAENTPLPLCKNIVDFIS